MFGTASISELHNDIYLGSACDYSASLKFSVKFLAHSQIAIITLYVSTTHKSPLSQKTSKLKHDIITAEAGWGHRICETHNLTIVQFPGQMQSLRFAHVS